MDSRALAMSGGDDVDAEDERDLLKACRRESIRILDYNPHIRTADIMWDEQPGWHY